MRETLRIFHAADLHLDSPFSGLPEDKARLRRRESRDMADRLADAVLAERADIVLLAGDLFDGGHVYPETLERLSAALERMACPVCIAPGNHDPYGPGCPYARQKWPDNVHIFTAETAEAFPVPQLDTVVWGAAFTGRQRLTGPLDGLVPEETEGFRLGCFHGDVSSGDSVYGPISRQEIARCGLHYLALGHIHRRSGLLIDGHTCWAYPGCPEGRGFDETGPKGALLIELTRHRAAERFIPLAGRQYRIAEADVTGKTAAAAAEEALDSCSAGDVCRVILTGESSESTVDTEGLERRLGEKYFSLEILDRTRPSRDIWDRAEEDSLRGLFLREMRQKYDAAANEKEKDLAVEAVRMGLAALEGRDME